MTNVSKRKLKENVVALLSDQLLTLIATADTKPRAYSLVMDLFTNAERTMLSKRLAIVIMLERGFSYSHIETSLRVSPTTIDRIRLHKEQGQYNSILRYCRKYTAQSTSKTHTEESFLDFLEVVLQAGMPPRGRGRWKDVFRSLHHTK